MQFRIGGTGWLTAAPTPPRGSPPQPRCPSACELLNAPAECLADAGIGLGTEHQPPRKRSILIGKPDHCVRHAVGVTLDHPGAAECLADLVGGGSFVGRERPGPSEIAAEPGPRRPGFNQCELNSEGGGLLRHGFHEPLDAPLGHVIEAESRIGDLASLARYL